MRALLFGLTFLVGLSNSVFAEDWTLYACYYKVPQASKGKPPISKSLKANGMGIWPHFDTLKQCQPYEHYLTNEDITYGYCAPAGTQNPCP